MIEVEVNGVIHEFPEGTSQEVMRQALQKKYGAPKPQKIQQQQARSRSKADYGREGIRTAGRAGRNVAGGFTGLVDTALLFPKTALLGAGLGLEALGAEEAGRFLQRGGMATGVRGQALGAIDQATNNALKPRNTAEAVTDFVAEMTVPTGGITGAIGKTAKSARPGTMPGTIAPTASAQGKAAAHVGSPSVAPAKQASITMETRPGRQIRLSRGQATQNPDIQEFEDLARSGVKGSTAQTAAIKFDTEQQKDVVGAFSRVLDDVNARDINEATDALVDIIKGQRSKLKRFVDGAYHRARDTSGGVGFAPQDVKEGLVRVAKDSLDEAGLTPNKNTTPVTFELYNQLRRQASGENVTALKLGALERWRTSVTQQAESLRGTADGKALNMMKRQYDEFMTTLADKAIQEGDTEAINAFKRARGLRARLGSLYEQNKIIDRLSRGEGGTVESVVADIFGASNFDTKRGAAETVKAIKTAARGQSAEVQHLMKQGVVSRVLNNAKSDRIIPGTEVNAISLPKLKTQLDKLLNGNASITREIFSGAEIKALRELQEDLRYVKSVQPGTTNYSQSGTRVLKALARVGGFARVLPGAEIATELAAPVRNAASAKRAQAVFANPEKLLAEAAKKMEKEARSARLMPYMTSITGGAAITAGNQLKSNEDQSQQEE